MKNIKRRIYQILTREKSYLKKDCWRLIEFLEPYESETAEKLLPKESYRNLFKIIFYYGCVKALADRTSFNSNKKIVQEIFGDTMKYSKLPFNQCSFGYTDDQCWRFLNFWWSKEKYFDTGWEDKWIIKLINAGKTAIDDVYEHKTMRFLRQIPIYRVHREFLLPLLPPLESLLHDKKFIKSASTGLVHFDIYMHGKIEDNKIEIRPK